MSIAEHDAKSESWAQHFKECEEGVISGLMADPVKISELVTFLSESDFADPFLATWYRYAAELQEAGQFTADRLRAELRRCGFLENVSDLTQFANLSEGIISTSLLYHASELKRMSSLRALRRVLTAQAYESEYLDADPQKIAAAIEAHLSAVTAATGKLWEDAHTVAKRVVENHRSVIEGDDSTQMGMATGFYDIDFMTGGFFRGQLWQIAARSYMGKSTVALAFAMRQIERNRGVYIASYEMVNEELMERLLADKTATPLNKFTQGRLQKSELAAVEVGAEWFRGRPLLLDERPPTSISALKARVKLAQNRQPTSLVIVDHLGLFPHDRKTPRHQQLVEVTRDLKAMAKDLQVAVLVLNQLNADADNEVPTDQHYAEAKGVLANLDVSILLHRENKTAPEMLVKLTKNRKGAPGECKLLFDGEIQRVETWTSGETWNG